MTEHYGRYRDDYDDEYDDYEDDAADHGDEGDAADHGDEGDAAEDHAAAERLDAADYDDHGAAHDTQDYEVRHDDGPERVDAADAADYGGDRRFLMEAADEVLDDPAVHESASSERIRRMKGGRRVQARDRRTGRWIPPDIRRFGQPVFWPADEPHEAPGPARRMDIDPFEVRRNVCSQALRTPLASGSELARARGLDEAEVTEAAQFLQQQGLLRSISFGCLLRPTARYWLAPEYVDGGPRGDLAQAFLSWHSNDGIGSLLRYSLPRVESINQIAARYAVDGWTLEGVAWVERDAVQAVGLYNSIESPQVKSVVYFVWVSQWDTEREIWERLADVPAAVRRITEPGIAGHVILVGADRWAVARALPMAVESLMASGVEPDHVAAWTYAGGWQAASGASMLDGAARPFTPTLATVRLDRFVWPRSRRRLGKTRLETVINRCPWTRLDARTLYRTLGLVGEYPGGSIAQYGALAGESDSELITRKRLATLLKLGLAREVGRAGVPSLGTADRPETLSARGRGQMRYRVSLGPKGEGEPPKRQPGESREDHARRTANGAFRLMLDHGELSHSEIVRRSGVGKLEDRFGDRLVHEDVLVDFLGRFTVLGCEVVPASRASTADEEGYGIDPDGMLYGSSRVGTGYHYFELERSHLGPTAIKARLEKYLLRRTSYPLAVVCWTDLGARHFDRIGQELGVPVVATSIPRLREIGLSGPAWIHHGQDVAVSPVPCPPQPATPPPPPAAL